MEVLKLLVSLYQRCATIVSFKLTFQAYLRLVCFCFFFLPFREIVFFSSS